MSKHSHSHLWSINQLVNQPNQLVKKPPRFGRWEEPEEPRQNSTQTVTQHQDSTGDPGDVKWQR